MITSEFPAVRMLHEIREGEQQQTTKHYYQTLLHTVQDPLLLCPYEIFKSDIHSEHPHDLIGR
jgi:hypothetical protein